MVSVVMTVVDEFVVVRVEIPDEVFEIGVEAFELLVESR